MKRRTGARPLPPKRAAHSTLTARTRHTTVGHGLLDKVAKPPAQARTPARPPKPSRPPGRRVARIVDDEESSLLDLIDNLLAKGVVLNADLILALANVDLVYVRLSALLCAADRVLPARTADPFPPKPRSGEDGPVPPKPRGGEGG